ncbi:hypothetical protein [Nisaea sp.]|uniref:hypothetical protein n=1 Tax=Nisaea sp. TaxID=2024842 RepID=UPI002B27A771|nr:hypothetical protein [Nisaea sp.]
MSQPAKPDCLSGLSRPKEAIGNGGLKPPVFELRNAFEVALEGGHQTLRHIGRHGDRVFPGRGADEIEQMRYEISPVKTVKPMPSK